MPDVDDYPPARRFAFFPPRPATSPGASLLFVQWSAEGEISFQAQTDDPNGMIGRLQSLLHVFAALPGLEVAAITGEEHDIRAAGIDYLGDIDVPTPVRLEELE